MAAIELPRSFHQQTVASWRRFRKAEKKTERGQTVASSLATGKADKEANCNRLHERRY